MARIRSIHPGLWTDEEFVALSLPARLFLIGLWNEADDFGLFAWKPLRLKMRLAPADAIDAEAILAELVEAGFLARLDRGGKQIGVVKNFRKFQRPKNPSLPMVTVDVEISRIIGLGEGDSPTPGLPQAHPSPTEIRPQMEEIRGSKEKDTSSLRSDAAPGVCGLSHEEEFWGVIVPQIEAAGIARSRAAQVAKMVGDFSRAVPILREVLKAKNPDTYIGGVLKRLREEAAAEAGIVVPHKPKRGEPKAPPEWVAEVRQMGLPVEWLGPGRWRDCDGDIVNDQRSVLSG